LEPNDELDAPNRGFQASRIAGFLIVDRPGVS
jgi:hypothetical protein